MNLRLQGAVEAQSLRGHGRPLSTRQCWQAKGGRCNPEPKMASKLISTVTEGSGPYPEDFWYYHLESEKHESKSQSSPPPETRSWPC